MINTLLFDLDGTFLDTAPEFTHVLNQVRQEFQYAPLALHQVRPWVSFGSKTLITQTFGLLSDHPTFEPLRARFLELYHAQLGTHTLPFEGLHALLDWWEGLGRPWGIVTSKPAWLTQPLLEKLGYWARAHVVVSGDTTPNGKPHPDPLWHACKQLKVAPEHGLYVGDAVKDIEAGQRAGMKTAVALYGYIPLNTDPHTWKADYALQSLSDLRSCLP